VNVIRKDYWRPASLWTIVLHRRDPFLILGPSETPVTAHSLPAIDLSQCVLHTISQDGAFVVCRAAQPAISREPASFLVVMPATEHPRTECVQMLEHEYALRADLDPAWAVRPRALLQHGGRPCLVFDDPGGELLAQRLGTPPMDVGLCLRLGAGLATALGALHRHGIIHKDLTPEHVMIDVATGQVWLTGFRIASRLRRERQTPEPPEVIAGTLPYMAPEQTGRMNRSIDSRSDLYALGVILYEMVTGTLPFAARAPMEWVHCHTARQAVPPAERARDVPAVVSGIIMRLLAKTAEQRYQTAAGVERDLRRCLTQWEAEHRIDDFRLGEHETPDRLLIPETLYGREREIATLFAAFDRVAETGTPELVLVSGSAGIGKSSVVNELHKALLTPRGLFVSGKFDQGRRGIPYASIAEAFQSLVRRLLATSDAELAVWRAALEDAVGPNGQLLIDLVPELKLILGEQPPVPGLPALEAQRRFQMVLQRFMRVFARPEHPLALFVDDLQWLDTATIDFLEDLLARSDVRHVLVIGAYRNNEVGPGHPLAQQLEAIREAGAVVHEIALAPLSRQDVAQLIADALHSQPERVVTLARLVCDKTAGNPFFTTQFLTALEDEGLLTFDHAHSRWSWDLDRIRAKRYTDNVADLMFDRLARLPSHAQRGLQSLACLGQSAEVTTLALVFGMSADRLHTDLWEAVRSELVERLGSSYRFLHDRVQEAAYALVPESERSCEHLRIGRLLVAHTPPERREETIFEIVNQLNRGATLMTSPDEREQLSRLNLIAGKRAKASAAHAAALDYFTSGARLLPDDAWKRCSELTFALELNRAECEFVTGDFASAEERLSIVAERVTNLVDEGSIAGLRIALYTVLRRFDRAIEIGLAYLSKVGITWSPHPTAEEVREEHERLWQQLGSRPIESLFDLPTMSDPQTRLTIDVLSELQGCSHWMDQNLEHLLLLRMANLSMQHGNTDASTVAYAYLGLVVGVRFGQYAAAYRFGLLAIDLVEKKGLDRANTRVYWGVGAWVVPWVRHLGEARPVLHRSLESCENWRPLPFYFMSIYGCLVTHGLASGEPLADVHREAEEGRRRVTHGARKAALLDFMAGQLGFIRTLRGVTPVFGSFGSEEIEEHHLEHYLQSPELGSRGRADAVRYWIFKLKAYVYSAEHVRAATIAGKLQRLLWTISAEFLEAEYHFYGALARTAAAEAATGDERPDLLAAVAGHRQRLIEWATNCPENFDSRAALVGAELARVEGRELDAERLYHTAIRSARTNRFVHIEALANELAGRFYGARGFDTSATAYLKEARNCYLRWGADGKVRQLDQHYPHLFPQERVWDSRSTISEHIERLDLETVLKALRAVSGEIVLERVIETLLRLAIEHAGADRGMLLNTSGAGLQMQAEATVDASGVRVQLREGPVSANDLAESVVQYVARAQDTVILDDPLTSDQFSTDVYIRRAHARSILCLPLMKQGRLVAVLYLENHLAPGVFTPARIAVLQVLAPQAAMALENSRLYRDLELREDRIRRLVDANIVGVAITRVDGAILDVNDAALEIIGYSREDVRSGRLRWRELTPPDWQAASDRAVAQLQATGSFDVFEKEFFRVDGRRVPVLLAGAAVDDTRQEAVVFVIDLTERKRAEVERERLRQLQADLAHVNRISMMGELAASLAHELKQPITAAITDTKTSLRWLSRDEPDVDRARKAIARVLSSGTRAADMIDRLRSFYKKDARAQHQLVDVNELVGEMLVLLRSEATQHAVSMRKDLAIDPCVITADPVQLQQVLMNLMLNGIEAMSDAGGELTVSSQVAHDGQIAISVSDTGVGLPSGQSDHIFAPFFSTKPQGTGMGLSISRSIVESHGGRLWATVNPGRGATFHFTLPADLVNRSITGSGV
jgi:PAS domain S-box-containing protein